MTCRPLMYLTTALVLVAPVAFAQPATAPDTIVEQAQGVQAPAAGDPAAEATAAGDAAPAEASTEEIAAEAAVTPPEGAVADPQATPEPATDVADSPDAALRAEAADWFEPIPRAAELPSGRPITRARADLGRMLFFDPRMSLSGVFSCHSCHNLGLGGTDQLEASVGHGWQQGPRNSPTMLNAVFNAAQFWDGRAEDLAEQAKGPVQAGVEMNNTPENLIATISSMPGYVEAFQTAFPGEDDPITFDNFALALEAFQTTLITPNSRFDQWLMGVDGAMNEQEKRGLQAYMDAGCTTCHAGVNFGGQEYFPFGLVEAPDAEVRPEGDVGRYEVTQTEEDQYVFRASPLRNVALTAPYFHSGKVWSLEEAVKIMANAQLGTELTEEQAEDITAFLITLNGEQPQVVHPTLPVRTDETPPPSPIDAAPGTDAAAN
ncbi:cytochrome c peroxidase [Paracoccus sp. (in: a-proteobacteria)]|uniref:cytochrome-c peroxidase n=1 Tax=Paracoccus sp. TaxID=267 RepID=UPI0034CE9A72